MFEGDRLVHRQRPVPAATRRLFRPRDAVGRRQAANVSEGGGVDLLVGAEHEKIGDRRVVQLARPRRMQADAVERVAEDDGLPELRVGEGLHAQMIARAEQTLLRLVPHGEREVAQQVRHAILTPDTVGAEDQFHIGSV